MTRVRSTGFEFVDRGSPVTARTGTVPAVQVSGLRIGTSRYGAAVAVGRHASSLAESSLRDCSSSPGSELVGMAVVWTWDELLRTAPGTQLAHGRWSASCHGRDHVSRGRTRGHRIGRCQISASSCAAALALSGPNRSSVRRAHSPDLGRAFTARLPWVAMTEAEVARSFTVAGAPLQHIGLLIAGQELENRGAGQGPIAHVRCPIRHRLAPVASRTIDPTRSHRPRHG